MQHFESYEAIKKTKTMADVKRYFDDSCSNHQAKRRHVQTNGHITICGRQEVEEKRLVKTFQQVVQTTKDTLHHSATTMHSQFQDFSEKIPSN